MTEQTERNPLRGVVKGLERDNKSLREQLAAMESRLAKFESDQQASNRQAVQAVHEAASRPTRAELDEARALRAAQRKSAQLFTSAEQVERDAEMWAAQQDDDDHESNPPYMPDEVDEPVIADEAHDNALPDEFIERLPPEVREELGLTRETERERQERELAEAQARLEAEREAAQAENDRLHDEWYESVIPEVERLQNFANSAPVPRSYPSSRHEAIARIRESRNSAELQDLLSRLKFVR